MAALSGGAGAVRQRVDGDGVVRRHRQSPGGSTKSSPPKRWSMFKKGSKTAKAGQLPPGAASPSSPTGGDTFSGGGSPPRSPPPGLEAGSAGSAGKRTSKIGHFFKKLTRGKSGSADLCVGPLPSRSAAAAAAAAAAAVAPVGGGTRVKRKVAVPPLLHPGAAPPALPWHRATLPAHRVPWCALPCMQRVPSVNDTQFLKLVIGFDGN